MPPLTAKPKTSSPRLVKSFSTSSASTPPQVQQLCVNASRQPMIQAKAKTIIAFNAMWAFASDLIEAYGPNGTNILTDAQLVSFQEAPETWPSEQRWTTGKVVSSQWMASTTRRREASFWPRAAKTKGPSASGSRISRPPVLKDWTTHPLSPSTCQRLQHLANGTSTCPESFFFATRSTAFSNSRPRKDHVAEVDGVPPGFLCPARGAQGPEPPGCGGQPNQSCHECAGRCPPPGRSCSGLASHRRRT